MTERVRPCGRCDGEDTMLICMECLRELKEKKNSKAIRKTTLLGIENGKAQRDMEVKQAIENSIAKEEHRMYGSIIIEVLTKLLQKLGLDAKEGGGESE